MSDLQTGVRIIILTLVLVTAIVLATLVLLNGVARAQTQAARSRFPNAKSVLTANFVGLASVNGIQVRSTGVFVITPDEVVFKKWMSAHEYRIPISAVQSVEMVKSFKGKYTLAPMLKINYRTDSGEIDAIGWSLRDAESVKQQIEALMRRQPA